MCGPLAVLRGSILWWGRNSRSSLEAPPADSPNSGDPSKNCLLPSGTELGAPPPPATPSSAPTPVDCQRARWGLSLQGFPADLAFAARAKSLLTFLLAPGEQGHCQEARKVQAHSRQEDGVTADRQEDGVTADRKQLSSPAALAPGVAGSRTPVMQKPKNLPADWSLAS